jgi:hypothetical protein
MVMKSAMARVMMRERSGVPVELASAMSKSVHSNMSMARAMPSKAFAMSGTVAVCRMPRAMDSELPARYAMPMRASALHMKTTRMRGATAVHLAPRARGRHRAQGCPHVPDHR